MVQRRNIVVDGVQLSYLERDANSHSGKAPLLLMHGLIASADTFGALLRELPQDRRIVALDLPGLDMPGRSEPSGL